MSPEAIIVIIALFAVVAVAAFFVFRHRAKVDIKGPLGTGLHINASNDPPPIDPAVVVEDAASRRGGLKADDETGRGAQVRRVEVDKDIEVSSRPSGGTDPKA
jgi:hypothetical protein